jgi:hypothetical protein
VFSIDSLVSPSGKHDSDGNYRGRFESFDSGGTSGNIGENALLPGVLEAIDFSVLSAERMEKTTEQILALTWRECARAP